METDIKRSFFVSVFFLLCHCALGFYEILSGSTTIPQEYANSSYVNRVRVDMMKKDITLNSIVCTCQSHTHISDYTILTTNYTNTNTSSVDQVEGLLFRNYCINDYGSELASFHSQSDDDLYFDLVGQYLTYPWGLRMMECVIGLTNLSHQPTWQWLDETPYDWGVEGTNSSKWSNHKGFLNRCVRIDNSLGENQRDWNSFRCASTRVNCGVCKTPHQRPYRLELEGVWNNVNSSINNVNDSFNVKNNTNTSTFVLLWVQLNGTDLFNTGINVIKFFSINITQYNWNYSQIWINYTNIGPIETITFLLQGTIANITINKIKINYFEDRAGSDPINIAIATQQSDQFDPESFYSDNDTCNVTILIKYWNQTYSIANETQYGNACIYRDNVLPALQPTSQPTKYPSGQPTSYPTEKPTELPTNVLISNQTQVLSTFPSIMPTKSPDTGDDSAKNLLDEDSQIIIGTTLFIYLSLFKVVFVV